MKKINVLQIPYGALGNGGVSSVILSIVENLHQYFNFTCLVFDEIGPRETIFRSYSDLHRIKFCYLFTNAWYRWFSIILRPFILYLNVYKLCKKRHIHAIHCHNGYDQWSCLLAAKHAGVKIRIAHSHTTKSPVKWSVFKRLYRYYAIKLINHYATLRIGCSQQACIDFFGNVPAQVIYNTVDLTRFDINKRTPFEGRRFIHVGRYDYSKNQEFVIEIFSLLKKELPNITLKLVGFGQNKELLENQIKRYHLEDSVSLIDGTKADIPTQYAESDYMIFPSNFEGFGIVLVEAQAMGIHCFVSEAIQSDVNVGLLTFLNLNEGPRKWADAVLCYIKQHNYPEILNKKDLQKFNPQNIAERYKKIYEGND